MIIGKFGEDAQDRMDACINATVSGIFDLLNKFPSETRSQLEKVGFLTKEEVISITGHMQNSVWIELFGKLILACPSEEILNKAILLLQKPKESE